MFSLGARPWCGAAALDRIVDRKKDCIIRRSYNMYPREVEEALHEHPAQRGLWFSYGQLCDQLVDEKATGS
jgi:acyl-CoA synthetase (AMP-forming)/AMP-acid ligase II